MGSACTKEICVNECPLCENEIESEEIPMTNGCSCCCCNQCWKRYVSMKVREMPSITQIRCWGKSCGGSIPEYRIRELILKEPKLLEIWKKALQKGVEVVEGTHGCPVCGVMFMIENDNMTEVTCPNPNCRRRICWKCKKEYDESHRQAGKCLQLASHEEAERKTREMLANHPRSGSCPDCNVPIWLEKGCHHMTCKCGYGFCFDCEQEWKRVGGYSHKCVGSKKKLERSKLKKRKEKERQEEEEEERQVEPVVFFPAEIEEIEVIVEQEQELDFVLKKKKKKKKFKKKKKTEKDKEIVKKKKKKKKKLPNIRIVGEESDE